MDSGFLEPLQLLLTEAVIFLPRLIAALFVFVVGMFLSVWLSRALTIGLRRQHADRELTLAIRQLVRWSLLIIFTIIGLQLIEFDLTAFAAGLGILGFTVGFALQDVSKNFIAGLLLLIQQPFDLEDVVELAGYSGRVKMVDLRSTQLRTFDGRDIHIPNGEVFTNPIVNYNRYPLRRIDLEMGLAVETDLEAARAVCLETVKAIKGVLEEPETSFYYDSFGDASIHCTVYFWVDVNILDPLTAKDRALVAIHDRFRQEGIRMPYPALRIYPLRMGGASDGHIGRGMRERSA